MAKVGEHCYFSGLFDKSLAGNIGVVIKINGSSIEVEPCLDWLKKIYGNVRSNRQNLIFEDEIKSNSFDLNLLRELNYCDKQEYRMQHECQFLLERLGDFINQIGDGEEYRNWNGHVAPAIARIEMMLENGAQQ